MKVGSVGVLQVGWQSTPPVFRLVLLHTEGRWGKTFWRQCMYLFHLKVTKVLKGKKYYRNLGKDLLSEQRI